MRFVYHSVHVTLFQSMSRNQFTDIHLSHSCIKILIFLSKQIFLLCINGPSSVPQRMKPCPTLTGGRSMIRHEATLSPERAHEEPAVVISTNRSALTLRTCSVTLTVLVSRRTLGINGIFGATFKPTRRRTEAAFRTPSAATCSTCFQTSSHSTDARAAASSTAHPASSAATRSLSAMETW